MRSQDVFEEEVNMFSGLIQGRVWKFGDNISTDLMLPAFLQDKGGSISLKERSKFCMFSNRPDWAGQVQPGDVIIARRNFGCGSSRPAAAQLLSLGISIVIAESISRIFFRNAINLGFPVSICKGIYDFFDEGDIADIDMIKGVIKNLTKGNAVSSETLPEHSPPMQILRAGGILAMLEKEYLKDLK
jgi:3-isopropylmalate/(R)-2-methylmalate dehydratase small subunit